MVATMSMDVAVAAGPFSFMCAAIMTILVMVIPTLVWWLYNRRRRRAGEIAAEAAGDYGQRRTRDFRNRDLGVKEPIDTRHMPDGAQRPREDERAERHRGPAKASGSSSTRTERTTPETAPSLEADEKRESAGIDDSNNE